MSARAGLFAAIALALLAPRAWADAAPAPDALPGPGFDGGRYANLWSKSPFAIATPEAPAASQDYQLVGLAQFDGISYVSLVDKQTQDHFVLSSDKPIKDAKSGLDLALISATRGPSGVLVIVQRNGESLTLRQEETAPASTPGQAPVAQPEMVPSPNPAVGGMIPVSQLPRAARIHRFVRVPPPPPPPPGE